MVCSKGKLYLYAKSSFVKIPPVGSKLFHADGQTDVHDEADSHFSKFCVRV